MIKHLDARSIDFEGGRLVKKFLISVIFFYRNVKILLPHSGGGGAQSISVSVHITFDFQVSFKFIFNP